jgi:hypothetical protein
MELRAEAEAEAFSAKNLKLHAEAFRREAYRRLRPRFARRKVRAGKGVTRGRWPIGGGTRSSIFYAVTGCFFGIMNRLGKVLGTCWSSLFLLSSTNIY